MVCALLAVMNEPWADGTDGDSCMLSWADGADAILLMHHAANCAGTHSYNGYTATGCPTAGNGGSGSCSSYSCPSGYSGTASGTVTCTAGQTSGTLSGCQGEWLLASIVT